MVVVPLACVQEAPEIRLVLPMVQFPEFVNPAATVRLRPFCTVKLPAAALVTRPASASVVPLLPV